MHVGAVLVLGTGPGFNVAEARRLLGERIRAVPRLRQRLRRAPPGCGRPFWADDPAFDLRHHVRQRQCLPPGDERALLEVAAAVTGEPLPRSRPLWSATFVTGLAGGGTGLVIVMNHVLADGIGGLAVLARLVDEAPALPPANPQAAGFPVPAPGARTLAADAWAGRARRLTHPAGSVRTFRQGLAELGGARPPPQAPADIAEPPHRDAAAARCHRRRSGRRPRPGSRPRRHRQRRDPRRHRRGAAGPAGKPGRATRPGDRIGAGVRAAGGHRRPARQPGRGDAAGPAHQRQPGRPRDPHRRDHPRAQDHSPRHVGGAARAAVPAAGPHRAAPLVRQPPAADSHLRHQPARPGGAAHLRRCPGAGGDPHPEHHRQCHRHVRRAVLCRDAGEYRPAWCWSA